MAKANDTRILIIQIAAVIVIAIGSLFLVRCSKRFNYNRYYQKHVQDTVRQMVKPECLQEGSHE